MKTPLYGQDEWVKIITETANDICEAKGWAKRVKEGDVIPVLMALSILKVVEKEKDRQLRGAKMESGRTPQTDGENNGERFCP